MLCDDFEGGIRLLTELELAQRWRISTKKLQADRCSGRGVPFVRIGRRVRYRMADILAYEAANLRSNTIERGDR